MDTLNSESDIYSDHDVLDVVDIRNLQSYLTIDETLNEEVDLFNMTSLSTLMLLNHATKECDNSIEEDTKLQRVSLAYERLHSMPKVLVEELAHNVKILDISNNEFENLTFLKDFHNLTTLICDHNNITSNTILPYMPKLELLWMNHCKVASLYPWAKKLQFSCPNLKYVSLMGNPVAPSYLNGGNFYEYLQYRLFIISLFPNLVHLDDRPVTEDQKQEALRMYHRPLMERLVTKTQTALPNYLRQVSEAVSDMLTPTPGFATTKRNAII